VHDAVGGWWAPPDGVLQVAPDAGQDDLEHGQAAAQPLLGQQVTLPSDGDLLGTEGYTDFLSTSEIPLAPNAAATWNLLTRAGHFLQTCVQQQGTLNFLVGHIQEPSEQERFETILT
jgi:hypothetical protein